jgi:hypothetical protein
VTRAFTRAWGGLRLGRILTSPVRLMPDFIIIGAQRCGTTSLYHHLVEHPCVVPAFKKEIHFFSLHFGRGVAWYRAHFPYRLYRGYMQRLHKKPFMTGEASPYYLFHPHAPKRASEVVPRVKLIVLLRNPVDRAYSHYHLLVRLGHETASFEDALGLEGERLHGETTRMIEDEDYFSFNHLYYSYLSRGIYVDQLMAWRSFFLQEQILVLRSEDFSDRPAMVMKRVADFLGLPVWDVGECKEYNQAHYPKMDAETRERLISYFKPHNQRLYDYLGVDLGWDN